MAQRHQYTGVMVPWCHSTLPLVLQISSAVNAELFDGQNISLVTAPFTWYSTTVHVTYPSVVHVTHRSAVPITCPSAVHVTYPSAIHMLTHPNAVHMITYPSAVHMITHLSTVHITYPSTVHMVPYPSAVDMIKLTYPSAVSAVNTEFLDGQATGKRAGRVGLVIFIAKVHIFHIQLQQEDNKYI